MLFVRLSLSDYDLAVLDLVEIKGMERLAVLEHEERGSDLTLSTEDLPLFSITNEDSDLHSVDAVREQLQQIEPDNLTPREALDTLYNLRRIMEADE